MAKPQHIRDVDVPLDSEVGIVQAFVRAEATSPDAAVSITALGLTTDEQWPTIHRLEKRGLLRRADGGRWYLDRAGYSARRRRRIVMVIVMAVALLILGAVVIR